MGRLIWASLTILLSAMPALAQSAPLQGKIEHSGEKNVEGYQTPKAPVEPRFPSSEDLHPKNLETNQAPRQPPPRLPSAKDLIPVLGSTASPLTNIWSMTILQNNGLSLSSPDISWIVEYNNSTLKHDWDVWLSRVVRAIYEDCARFKCPATADHMCAIHIRRDGVTLSKVVPGNDIPSTLFKNAVARLQHTQVLDFPAESKQEKVELYLTLHYGKPVQDSSIFTDAFGQTDARYPLLKSNW